MGYPSVDDLRRIEAWPIESGYRDCTALLAFVRSIWEFEEWGFHGPKVETDAVLNHDADRYDVSTGGWSGNEEMIEAMHRNFIFWSLCWDLHRRGGHYVFLVPHERQP